MGVKWQGVDIPEPDIRRVVDGHELALADEAGRIEPPAGERAGDSVLGRELPDRHAMVEREFRKPGAVEKTGQDRFEGVEERHHQQGADNCDQ